MESKKTWFRYKWQIKWAILQLSTASSKFHGKWRILRCGVNICVLLNATGIGKYLIIIYKTS